MSKKKKLEDGLNRLFSTPPQTSKTETNPFIGETDDQAGDEQPENDVVSPEQVDPIPADETTLIEEASQNIQEPTDQPFIQNSPVIESTPAEDLVQEDNTSLPEVSSVQDNEVEVLPEKPASEDEAIVTARGKYDFDDEQIVIFSLSNQLFGINISSVESIIKMQAITEVPRSPEYLKGVTNLRGRVVPVFNLCARLGLPEKDYTKENRIVIVNISGYDAGMIVDEVKSVTQVSGKNINPPSEMIAMDSSFVRAIANIDNILVVLLELSEIFVFQLGSIK